MSIKKILLVSLITFFCSQKVIANAGSVKIAPPPTMRTYQIQLGVTNVDDAQALGIFVGMVNSETFKPVNSYCVISDLKTKPERKVSFIHLPSNVMGDGYDGYIVDINSGWPDSTITMTAECASNNDPSALSIHAIGRKTELKFIVVNDKLIPIEIKKSDDNHFFGYIFNK